MSYKLEYPYTEEQRANFIVEYNHTKGLRIETVDNFVEVETSHYEPSYDADGNFVEEVLVVDTIEENMPTLYALETWEKLVDGEVVDNTEEWEEEQKRKEQERIAMLNLTAADVERGIYKARGMDFEDIIAFITQLSQTVVDEETGEVIQQGIEVDIKALKIELKANHFYRGNSYVNLIGNFLGFTSEQLDKFFEDGNYEHLL